MRVLSLVTLMVAAFLCAGRSAATTEPSLAAVLLHVALVVNLRSENPISNTVVIQVEIAPANLTEAA